MVVAGLPGPVDKYAGAALAHAANDAIPKLEERPTITAVTGEQELMRPYWDKQFFWDSGRYGARIGHRYVSVHFVRRPEAARYDRFDTSLEPWTTKWLELYARSLARTAKEHQVDHIGFGYVNSFTFPLHGFDLGAHFKLQQTVDVGGREQTLLGMTSAFRLAGEDEKETLLVEVDVEPTGPTVITVTTKVYAEYAGIEGIAFADMEKLATVVRKVKQSAKKAFFDFATDATHESMGARP